MVAAMGSLLKNELELQGRDFVRFVVCVMERKEVMPMVYCMENTARGGIDGTGGVGWLLFFGDDNY
jgi:hypothetical protein